MPTQVTADAAVLPLAAGFANPGHAAWLALAERTLKGAPIESLTWRTVEGLEVGPLYQPAAWPPLPGGQSRGWDIRTVVGGPDVAAS